MKEDVLRVKNLTLSARDKNTGRAEMLKDINFSVKQGQIVGFIGETGSGKTLTMLAIMGRLSKGIRIDQGEINFLGYDLLGSADREIERVRTRDLAMIFQNQVLSLSQIHKISTQMKDLVRVSHPQLSGRALDRFCLELLSDVGFEDPEDIYRKYPFEISGGMAQRVILAIVMSRSPKLLIADEPTTALDIQAQNTILMLLKSYQKKLGNSQIIITHDFNVVEKICTHVVVMKSGKIVEKGLVKDILENPQEDYTKQLIDMREKYKK